MKVRELIDQDLMGVSVEGIPVRQVKRVTGGYWVHLGSGETIVCKGHDCIEDLKRPSAYLTSASRERRPRTYGEFGSTID